MKIYFFMLFAIPIGLLAQAKTWQLESDLGFNLSINRMMKIQGEPRNMSNNIRPGGYWSILVKYQFNNKLLLFGGIDHAAYKYQYRYRIAREGGGSSSKSTVYIWGFPLGIENQWTHSRIAFASGYGFQYRLNRLGSPFDLEASSTVLNTANEMVFQQSLKEFDTKQNNHLISLFAYLKIIFKLKPNFHLSMKVNYNHGLRIHEEFKYHAVNSYPLEGKVSIDEFHYISKASYISTVLGFNYIIQKNKKKNIDIINQSEVYPD